MKPLLGSLGRWNVISSLTLWQYSRELFHGLMQNYLALNVRESHFLIFSRNRIALPQLTHLQVSRGSLCRPENRVVRFHGILLDENLSLRNYIAMIKFKVSRSLGIIRKLRHTFSGSILKFLFFCFVQPYVSYCPIVWMSTFSSTLRSLLVMDTKAWRLAMDTNRSSLTPLLSLQSIYVIAYV